ncbi:MAG: DNA-3-methyladenine glycosylase I [Bowdeniella nasicola]|nr:DNA-3-methyladenine glycosylase I [Bowdeniella nasicola]
MPAPPDLILGEDGLARPAWATRDPLLTTYYDTEWGMPIRDEQGIFERLCLEGFQAGLSWLLVLRRRPHLRRALAAFDPDVLATWTEDDIDTALEAPGVIRNRQKIAAVVTNARATLALRADGGLAPLVWSYQPDLTPRPRTAAEVPSRSAESEALARELKRRGFTFVGPTSAFALMEAIGVVDTHLVGSHRRGSSGVWDRESDRPIADTQDGGHPASTRE